MKKLPWILCLILFVSLCASLYHNVVARRHFLVERDTVTYIDTIVKLHPITLTKDSLVVRHYTEYVPIHYPGQNTTDTIIKDKLIVMVDTITDSVRVEVPILQKEYGDSSYHAWISGYQASLDSIKLFPKTTVITQTIEKRNKWGLGIQLGVGITPQKIQPYIGVGVNYNIFSW